MTPWHLLLVAQRWTPFTYVVQFPPGVDLTGAGLRAQMRLYPDQPHQPVVDLARAHPNGQGLSTTTETDPDTGVVTSFLRIRINKSTMRAMPAAGEIGEAARFAWDLHVNLPGLDEAVWIEGPFTVLPGVTQ